MSEREEDCPVCAAMGEMYDDTLEQEQRHEEMFDAAVELALEESMAAASSNHPWDRGYRAGAAAVWSKLRALRHS